jgi:hypothetical protein
VRAGVTEREIRVGLLHTILNGPGQPESLNVTVPGGTTAYIIVDGENVTRGPFTLTVTP